MTTISNAVVTADSGNAPGSGILHDSLETGSFEAYLNLGSESLHRRYALDELLDGPISGKSLLHIGCDGGELCLEALESGASRVVGIDADRTAIRYARSRAEQVNGDIRFYSWDEMDPAEIQESFDIVVCISEFERVLSSLGLVNGLSRLARDRLILGCRRWEARSLKGRLRSRVPGWLLSQLKRLPVAVFAKDINRGHNQTFYSPEALRHLLLYQTYRFGKVDIVDNAASSHLFVQAHRRRIDNLIVLAGPDAAGKSTLTKAIIEGNQPDILHTLGIEAVDRWTSVHPQIVPYVDEHATNVVLHYNSLNVRKSYCRNFHRDPILTFLENARNLHIVTVWSDTKSLQARVAKRFEFSRGTRREEVTERVLGFYAHDALVADLYRDWFDYCERTAPGNHWVFEADHGGGFYRFHDWPGRSALAGRNEEP